MGLLKNVGAEILAPGAGSSPHADVTDYVKIKIGTGGHGHTYPGATVPFGMVQLSPDTFNDGDDKTGWDHCSGYHIADKYISGFSHTHLSGTGCADLLDFLVMPGTGPAKTVTGNRGHAEDGYRARFSHDDEIAEPGYYSVLLKDLNIRAELSATERVGIHKYTFPKSDTSHILLDLLHTDDDKTDGMLWSKLTVVGNDAVVGGRSTDQWAGGREIYFAMKFSKPFTSFEIVSADKPLADGTRLSLHHCGRRGSVGEGGPLQRQRRRRREESACGNARLGFLQRQEKRARSLGARTLLHSRGIQQSAAEGNLLHRPLSRVCCAHPL
jgi:putative alpha-1,2-mannosidase